jgi:hypothetical protein
MEVAGLSPRLRRTLPVLRDSGGFSELHRKIRELRFSEAGRRFRPACRHHQYC